MDLTYQDFMNAAEALICSGCANSKLTGDVDVGL